jgi:hypothetical protein
MRILILFKFIYRSKGTPPYNYLQSFLDECFSPTLVKKTTSWELCPHTFSEMEKMSRFFWTLFRSFHGTGRSEAMLRKGCGEVKLYKCTQK